MWAEKCTFCGFHVRNVVTETFKTQTPHPIRRGHSEVAILASKLPLGKKVPLPKSCSPPQRRCTLLCMRACMRRLQIPCFRQSLPHFGWTRIPGFPTQPGPCSRVQITLPLVSTHGGGLGSLRDALVMIGHRAWAWGVDMLCYVCHAKSPVQPRRQAARIQQLREDLPGRHRHRRRHRRRHTYNTHTHRQRHTDTHTHTLSHTHTLNPNNPNPTPARARETD